MIDITMPKLSDSMEEGTILTWLRQDGEHVEAGEDLVELETDKATMTHAAEASGTLSIVAAEGTTLPVGALIARLGDGHPAGPGGATGGRPQASSETVLGSSGVALHAAAAAPVTGDGHPESGRNGTGARATPLARRAARLHGVSLEDLVGTGPLGCVTRGDVLARAGLSPAPPAPAAAKGAVEVVEPTRLQAVIARRMAEVKATVPDFQVQTDVVMDAAIAFRAELKATGAATPSFNDLVVKAAGLALRRHPRANGSYRDGHFELHARVNVGIAVAAPDALVVPAVFDADRGSLGAIAAETRRLAERVRDGSVTPPELSGATFTVSNLGMYGMTAITPVINAPQAAILGVGATRAVLARVDGAVVDRHLMTLTLSCDHRILYGADAAQFLSDIRELLEQPLRLVL